VSCKSETRLPLGLDVQYDFYVFLEVSH